MKKTTTKEEAKGEGMGMGMETAKVDIEKLQLLNDRIVQTIEALNQVRMSVHGLQSARSQGAQIPVGQFGGLSHTGGFGQQNPWMQQQTPFAQQQNPWLLQQQNPWMQQQFPQQFSQQIPQYAQQGIGGFGLSHTGIDPYRLGAVDPTVYARIVQTFPFLVTDSPSARQFY